MAQQRITRDDLEARFRSLQDDVQNKVNDRKQALTSAAIAGSVVLLLLFFLLGKRSGKKKTTFVEIRRV
ncbi:MAG: hypothetical protein RLZZ623_1579 [Actinomycetota bacterium]|jgi:hypothetical protein